MSWGRGRARRSWMDESAFRLLSLEEVLASVRIGLGPRPTLSEQLRILVSVGRPRTCGVGLLSMAVAIGVEAGDLSLRSALLLLIAAGFSFVANVQNAFADVAEDFCNLPGRVYTVARMSLRTGYAWLALLHVLMLLAAGLLGTLCLLLTGLGLLIASQYSVRPLRAKARPVMGLAIFALAVAYPPLLAPFAQASPESLAAWAARVERMGALSGYLALWFAAKGLIKNIPDFLGDLAAGVKTSATVMGSYTRACLVAAAATGLVYGLPLVSALSAVATVPPLAAALWLVPAVANALSLLRTQPGPRANAVLGRDMYLSSGFLATWLALVAPPALTIASVSAVLVLFVLSDLFGFDSRRRLDARV